MSSTSVVDEKDLCSASRDSDVALLSQLLADDTFNAENATAALKEAKRNTAIFRILLEHGADANVVPIHWLQWCDEPGELMILLAEYGYDFKSKGHKILQDFAHDRETLDCLLDLGADINRTDTRRRDNGSVLALGEMDSSLHLLNNVAASGDIELFDHLVSRGADPSLCTALHAASKCKNAETSIAMVCHLLDKHNMDIDRNKDDLRHFIHDPRDEGSPLCSAILHKNLPVVHELLKRGARVNDSPWFPVYYAVDTGGFLPALEPLLRAGADATEALKISASTTNIDAAKACLQYSPDPAPALREAIEWEERRVHRIMSDAEYDRMHPELSYEKSEEEVEEEKAEERDSQAMVELLKSAVK
ncbi:hypothetical protein Q7P37_009004 [Cladosporium fusiforme]